MLHCAVGFWMSDKPLVQQALASELVELLLTISDTSSALNFLRGFWVTLVREWNGIDRLRCAYPSVCVWFAAQMVHILGWTNITCLFEDLSMRHSDVSYELNGRNLHARIITLC